MPGERNANYWQDWVNLALAVWLFISPWVLGFAGLPGAAWNAWIVGVGVAVFAIAALVQFARWQEGVTIVLGLWLIISPWVVGYDAYPTPLWNSLIVGILVAALAAWNAAAHREAAEAA